MEDCLNRESLPLLRQINLTSLWIIFFSFLICPILVFRSSEIEMFGVVRLTTLDNRFA